MKMLVLMKMVLDTVDELRIDASGKGVDTDAVRFILNEVDNHALEQAVLLKEKYGGHVTVMAIDAPEIDDAFFTSIAKGADRVIKVSTGQEKMNTRTMAKVLQSAIQKLNTPFDLILTGVQASDDLDGEAAPFLAHSMKMPYLGVITGLTVDPNAKKGVAVKEFAGGLRGEFDIPLPSVLGIQAAEKPPRYVPVAKIRNAMKTGKIESLDVSGVQPVAGIETRKMYKPVTQRATMLEGSPEDVSAKIVELIAKAGVLKGVGQ
jgi:electron transfer flavoprotein beta subunit